MKIEAFNPIPLGALVPGLAESPFQSDELARTSYRPTVVIGVGGTGLAVVRKLKMLLRRYFRQEQLDIFQFLCIDTAAEELREGEQPLDAGEFVYLGAFDAADLIRHLDENEYIAPWWPGGNERPYRPTFSGTGANRVRAVGRLVLFNYLGNTIIPRLETKIDRAIEINAQHGMGATSIKFYVVCSLAGGTGAGMALDLAYVARMLGLRRQPTAYVTGVMVLDDAFLPKAHTANTKSEFSANTYAALREINHFSATRKFHETYDDITNTSELPEGFRPFDVAYLLSLHNAEGQALESFDSLADMIAAEMMLEIASPLHGRTENVLDNVRANERAIAGQPAAYSSFALSSLVYPLPGIASWCALKAHADFSTKVLLTPRRQATEVEEDVVAFAQQAEVEEEQSDSLIDRLNVDERGQALLTPAISHDQVGGVAEHQLLGALQRMEESAQAELAHIRASIQAREDEVVRAYQQAVRAKAEAILRDPQRGPRYAAWFLEHLTGKLTDYRDEQMVAEQSMFRADAQGHEAAWRAARRSLARVLRLPRIIPWRSWQLGNARSAYASATNAYLSALHELERRTQAVLCFNTFVEETRDLARQANDLQNEWTKLAAVAEQRAATETTQEQATETEYSLMRNIVGREELERTFADHLPQMDAPEACDFLASRFWVFFDQAAPGWSLATPHQPPPVNGGNEGGPPVQAYYFLFDHYARSLSGKALIARLKEIYGPGWKHEIELRYRQTAPFWNYNLSRFGDKIRNNLQHEPRLVGYGEDDVTGWSQAVSGATGEPVDGVNNKNPHEMLFLKTSHGLPLFALRSANQVMRNAYEYVKRLWENAAPGTNPVPVHVSRTWEAELLPLSPQPTTPATPASAPEAESPDGHPRPPNGDGAAAPPPRAAPDARDMPAEPVRPAGPGSGAEEPEMVVQATEAEDGAAGD